MKVALLLCCLFLGGCADSLRELANDPAIVGFTGFRLRFGLNPAPEVGGAPLPNIEISYGTLWRIGGNRDVSITVGTATNIGEGGQGGIIGGIVGAIKDMKEGDQKVATPAKTANIPELSSRASLHITAKNSPYEETPKKVKKQKVKKSKVKELGNEKPGAPVAPGK